jgi:hypothetical protein
MLTRLVHWLIVRMSPWYHEREHLARIEEAGAKLRVAEDKKRGADRQADDAREIKRQALAARAKLVQH